MIISLIKSINKQIFIISIIALFFILNYNIEKPQEDIKKVLELILNISSISTAIIITFLFSKLYSERSQRIERKKEIDIYSKKLLFIRSIAYRLMNFNSLWIANSKNVKFIIQTTYSALTYEDYRNDLSKNGMSYDEWSALNEAIVGEVGQAFLAIKGLKDYEIGMVFSSDYNYRNYELEELIRFRAYCNSIWYYLDGLSDADDRIRLISSFDRNEFENLYFKIFGKRISGIEFSNALKEPFEYIESEIFDRYIYLSHLNSNTFPDELKKMFFNLILNLIVVIMILFNFLMTFSDFKFVPSLICSIFIINSLNLVYIVYNTIKEELKVNELFSH